jgi:iron complex outermembrane receptor protein
MACAAVLCIADQEQARAIALKRLSLEELSKIEVTTTSKEAAAAFQTPVALSILTSEDIARSGATSIPEALRLVPGVEVAQINGDKWAIGIRGFEGYLSRGVLVLIDGRSVYTPLFAGVYWEMQGTLLEDIDRIEVIRGPGATIWGSNAVNGVINIITKSSRETHGAMVSAAGGNVEQGSLNMRYGGGDDRLSYRIWGRGFTRGPQFHPDNRNFDDWRKGQAGFRLDWSPNARDSVSVSGDAYSIIAGTVLGISTYSPPALNNVYGNASLSGQNVVAAWRRDLGNGADLQVRAYFDRTDRFDLNYHEVRDTVDFDFIHHVPIGRHDIIWGGGARVSPSHFIQTVPTVIFTPARETYGIYSGFLQDTIELIPNRLSFTAGTKLEHNSYSAFNAQPSGRIAWTPTERNTFWAAVTRAVRTPSRVEQGFQYTSLAVQSIPLYLRLVGDAQFNNEQLVGYEAGYRAYIAKTGFVSLSTFYNRYDDLLSVENRPPAPETTPAPTHFILPLYFRNGIATQTKGMELAALMDIAPWWRIKPSYSYLHLDAGRYPTSNDASTQNQLEGDTPQHKVVIQSYFNLPHGIEFDATYRFVSGLPDIKVAAYSTGDVRFAKKIGRDFEISVVGQNLMQPWHLEYSTVGIQRAGYVKVTWLQ